MYPNISGAPVVVNISMFILNFHAINEQDMVKHTDWFVCNNHVRTVQVKRRPTVLKQLKTALLA